MSKISDKLNKSEYYIDNPYIGNPHWCASHPGFKEKYNALNESEKKEFDEFSREVQSRTDKILKDNCNLPLYDEVIKNAYKTQNYDLYDKLKSYDKMNHSKKIPNYDLLKRHDTEAIKKAEAAEKLIRKWAPYIDTIYDTFPVWPKSEKINYAEYLEKNCKTKEECVSYIQSVISEIRNPKYEYKRPEIIARSPSKLKINQEIDRPSHYGSKSGKDVIEWCEDFGIMDNAYVFNVFKYLCRAGHKENNSELQDALKARVYLDRYIEKLQKTN